MTDASAEARQLELTLPGDVAHWLASHRQNEAEQIIAAVREKMARETAVQETSTLEPVSPASDPHRVWTEEELVAGWQLLADTPEYQDMVFPNRAQFEALALLDEGGLRAEDFEEDSPL